VLYVLLKKFPSNTTSACSVGRCNDGGNSGRDDVPKCGEHTTNSR
jgi:hypothetical protein